MNTSEFDDAKERNGDLVQGALPAGTVAPDFTFTQPLINSCRCVS